MSLSFEDSLKKMSKMRIADISNDRDNEIESDCGNTLAMATAAPLTFADGEEPETVAAYALDDNGWIQDDVKYVRYDEYKDNNVSTIDEHKMISLNPKQFNITQEANSQFIPFEMPRFYDGYDLTKASIMIHFVNRDRHGDYAPAVNVSYNKDRIRFAWLVDERATVVDGNLAFEIQARGTNSKGETYIWKTRSNDKLIVHKSLSEDGTITIEPDESWIVSFMTQITEQVAIAQGAAQDAQNAVVETQELVQQVLDAADRVDDVVDTAKAELTDTVQTAVDSKVAVALLAYYTKAEVDDIVNNIDISDQLDDIKEQIANLDGLAKFNVEYDGTTMTFYNGDEVMNEIDINSDPSQEWADAFKVVVDQKIADATYSKSEADAKFATTANVSNIAATVDTNKGNITSLGTKITELESAVGSIDTSPRLTYDATYDEENVYTLWEIEGEGDEDEVRTAKSQFKLAGGGGGSTGSVLKIEYITASPIVATLDDRVIIKYNFSGIDSSGDAVTDGSATWRVAGRAVATNTAIAGENSFDITDYLTVGTQKVNLSIVDDMGSLVTKTWTVQKIDVRIASTFNDKLTYPIGKVTFDYTPYGAIQKTVHFVLDGTEIGTVQTASSGIPMAYEIPEQQHGSHMLEVYMTADVNGNVIESNHIVKDIIWYDANSDVPVIGCVKQSFTARQYDATNIEYTVYDPTTENPVVTLAVDGNVVSTLTLDSNTQVWQYKSSDVGEHVLTITCGKTVKTLNVTIEKLDIDLDPVMAGLMFDFNPSGRSNNDADRLWTYDDVSMSVSDNFDWVNGGYQIDDNGDQYFCIKSGTYAIIDHKLFEDDAKRNGKEFKFVFRTTNVRSADAQFLKCVDGPDNAKVGIEMNAHEAYIHASAGSLYLPYSEEDVIEFEFNINKNTDSIPMVMGYEDGVATRPMVYTDAHGFTQVAPQYITIGSEDCDVHVYRMKAYNTALTDKGILNNFIADARNAEEMIARYNRNQIYDENNQLTAEVLAERCPHLRIIKIDAPHFTNNKSDKVSGTTIQYIHKGGDPVLDNWIATNARHSGQGTTSNEYGAAGRNLDLIMNKGAEITLGDGVTKADGITLTRDSVEVAYLNVKVNIASSENANNSLLQRRYNEYNPYVRPAKENDPKVKDTMEFHNCVVFVRESDPDVSTHREFNDTDWHFYAIGNVGDSKKTDKTRLNDKNDPLECIVEIMDNTLPNSTFPADQTGLDNLEKDPFDESMTYGWRYSYDDEDQSVTGPCIEKWKEFYKFVATSTDEEFKANLKDYFVVDSALFFYLFTTRYTMIDNRAKNTFWHYGKCSDGVYRWDLCFNYDNDTGLGINNSGELTMTYGYEDTDYKTKGDESTGYAFNAATSTFFCRIRDLFVEELREMFVRCESEGAWSAEGLINQFDEWQSEFPEELWRVDIERKYLRPYREGSPRFLTTMANGKKKYQRRQFERNQEKYMASKFFGNVAVADQIMFRCNTPTDENLAVKPDYTLHLTPYADMYIDVLFGATYRTQVRAEAGKQYDIECPFTTMDDTAVLIYCSSLIQSMGDISACYIHDNDFSKASKLKELIIGNATEGYKNSFLTNLGIGNNSLLEKLDIQNTPNLAQALNLSGCGNLRELYAHGSGLTGVAFADGGMIEIAKLPSVNVLTMKNLAYLDDFDVTSFENLNTLIVENCGTIELVDMLESAPNITRARIIGVNWSLQNTDLLEYIYGMSGVDKNGYNVPQSVLTGKVHVPVIRQQQIYEYSDAWPDLEVTFDTMIEQYAVTFVNDDGTVLDVQYIDKGGDAVDPVTRENNPIPIPTKESTVSTDFTYSGWDSPLTAIFSARTIRATYTESIRKYTVKYVSRGIVMQESVGYYGENIVYNGETPTYTLEESAYKYYLFNRWDSSGYIDGDKVVNAIFDSFEYNSDYFRGKEISDLSPVELYAVTKLGLDLVPLDVYTGDKYTFELGYDVDYDDIDSEIVISEKTRFDGSKYIDTGVKLFDTDKDFVLAIDYEFLNGNSLNSVLAQCFQANGSNGFKLWYNNGVKLTWGTSSASPASANNREMLVIRHKKGDNNVIVYNSNLDELDIDVSELTRTRPTIADSTLVFGCAKADDGAYENYAYGDIHWCKVWYADLGDEACRKLAGWTHEKVEMEVCGFKNYYLADNPSKRCNFTMLATHLLERARTYNETNTTVGGWASSKLNAFLNTRFYNAFPVQIKALVQKVNIASSVGSGSHDISTSGCYVAIPSLIEVDGSKTTEPYIYEGSTIDYMISEDARKRSYVDGAASLYWLRSPNVANGTYIWHVTAAGATNGYQNAYNKMGVLIEVSL